MKTGCFKPALFGCLGLFVIIVIFVGGSALVAWNKIGDRQVADRVLTPVEASVSADGLVSGAKETPVPPGTGRVVLDLRQGEFQIHPAAPGEGLRVEAEYDRAVYVVEDHYEAFADSSWVYGVRTYQSISGLHSLFRQIMGGGHSTAIHIYLPTDVPIELFLKAEAGAMECEWGGLWLTEADVDFRKGGFSLSIDEPLKEPMSRLSIHGRMGGFELSRLGNASPAVLDVRCEMGGGEVDLRGQWVQDSSISLQVMMGGMAAIMPRDVIIEGSDSEGVSLSSTNAEVARPTLRVSVTQKWGEIEID